MMVTDYKLTVNSGSLSMSFDGAAGILNDLAISLTIKAASLEKDSNGLPVYPGDWWFDPSFGHNLYEIKTINDANIKYAENLVKKATEWIVIAKLAKAISVSAARDSNTRNRINIVVNAIQSDDQPVTYETFYEVV